MIQGLEVSQRISVVIKLRDVANKIDKVAASVISASKLKYLKKNNCLAFNIIRYFFLF